MQQATTSGADKHQLHRSCGKLFESLVKTFCAYPTLQPNMSSKDRPRSSTEQSVSPVSCRNARAFSPSLASSNFFGLVAAAHDPAVRAPPRADAPPAPAVRPGGGSLHRGDARLHPDAAPALRRRGGDCGRNDDGSFRSASLPKHGASRRASRGLRLQSERGAPARASTRHGCSGGCRSGRSSTCRPSGPRPYASRHSGARRRLPCRPKDPSVQIPPPLGTFPKTASAHRARAPKETRVLTS